MTEQREICTYCNSTFKNKTVLKTHLNTNKKCLELRGLSLKTNFICDGCNTMYISLKHLSIHQESCKEYQQFIINEKHQKELKEKLKEQELYYIEKLRKQDLENNKKLKEVKDIHEKELHEKELEYKEKLFKQEEKLKETQTKYDYLQQQYNEVKEECKVRQNKYESVLERLALDAVNKPALFNNEDVIEIDNDTEDIDEEYKLQPLDLGDNLYIENRDDGYINVTNLCKAGNKKFNDWSRLDNTKAFLKELSRSAGIPADLLIQSITGGKNEDRKTWVHPYVAINIAQWISPQFDVKVSSWIYEVMLTGKIDISNTKSFQQLRLENKEHKLKIKYLTKKYVKLQPRVQYNEKNVIYILTTPSHKKEGKYILGKASNLTNRLSTYNKTDEHEVVYYQECPDEDTMSIVEQLIFHKLKNYREQANRERFILPENKTIELFIDVIKKSIENL